MHSVPGQVGVAVEETGQNGVGMNYIGGVKIGSVLCVPDRDNFASIDFDKAVFNDFFGAAGYDSADEYFVFGAKVDHRLDDLLVTPCGWFRHLFSCG
jgi:hypothetical protein